MSPIPPFTTQLPAELWFRVAAVPANFSYPVHSHRWGEFVYSFSGVMEVQTVKGHFTAPTHYGIWLPPSVRHMGFNRNEATHCSFYIMPEFCAEMPEQPCTLQICDFVVSILNFLRSETLSLPLSESAFRILRVLCDQLIEAPRQDSFLPMTQDPLLKKFLLKMEQCPADNTPIQDMARQVGTTLRTVNRRSLELLGITLNEWRQRMRVVKAIDMLERGDKVENVAFNVGYSSASAFISMFSRVSGQTPGSIRAPFGKRKSLGVNTTF